MKPIHNKDYSVVKTYSISAISGVCLSAKRGIFISSKANY